MSRVKSLLALLAFSALAVAWFVPVRVHAQLKSEGAVAVTLARTDRLATRLLQLTKEGFRVDVVAVPDWPFVPENVVVLLSQSPAAATIDYEVVDDSRLWKVAEDVSALAEKGYVLRGFTVAKPRLPGPMGYIAVMERATPATPPSREYRLVNTRGTAADWKVLEKAAADGFSVVSAYVRPDAVLSASSDIVFVCERDRGAPPVPMVLSLKWKDRDVPIEKEINAAAAKGEVLQAFWASRMYLNALMVRPAKGPAGPPRQYVVDSDPLGTPSVSSMDGRLVNWVRYRDDQQVSAYEKGARGGYDMLSEDVPDYDWNATGVRLRDDRTLVSRDERLASCSDRRASKIDAWLPCEAWRLRDRLLGQQKSGNRAVAARYHRDAKGKLTVDVILRSGPAE